MNRPGVVGGGAGDAAKMPRFGNKNKDMTRPAPHGLNRRICICTSFFLNKMNFITGKNWRFRGTRGRLERTGMAYSQRGPGFPLPWCSPSQDSCARASLNALAVSGLRSVLCGSHRITTLPPWEVWIQDQYHQYSLWIQLKKNRRIR
jgi:hypothetical protein